MQATREDIDDGYITYNFMLSLTLRKTENVSQGIVSVNKLFKMFNECDHHSAAEPPYETSNTLIWFLTK